MTGRANKGFTLIELLVVISIMSLLMAILLPALGEAKKTAQSAKCKSNLKQIAIANAAYMNFNNSAYPRPWSEEGMYYGEGGNNGFDNQIMMFHFVDLYPWQFGTPQDDGMLTPYVNKNTEVFKCPMYWSTRVKGDAADGGPLYGGRSLLPDDLEDIGWSYGINANLKGLEKLLRAGYAIQASYWNSPIQIYEQDVKRPSTCTAYLDSNCDENFSHVATPDWFYTVDPTGWWDLATFLQDGTTWVGQQPGTAHSRANLGYNCVFADGHGENVTVASHFDLWNNDATYWSLDSN